ncbi:MAG: NAD(P)-dependent alcohol dehydrogenase [Chloroflexi bacterium]|nr:NAD(P)-dependent alcohol dehydrogenase [Chloroflexota bacterium]
MKAIVHRRYGPPEVLTLEELPSPEPGPGEVRVRVRAASIFAGDWHIVRGAPFFVRFSTGLRRPRNPIPGIDLAGAVDQVGPGVSGLHVGDEVFGFASGSLAESVCVPADHLVRRPSVLTVEEAASIPEAGMTALQGLRDHGRVRAGQRVLVIGASGGVGTFAVQIAKALGAEVTGVCGPTNLDLVRSIGADHVIDRTRTDVTAGADRYDVILQLAGTVSPRRLRRALVPGGTLVLSDGDGRLAGVDRILAATLLRPFVRERLAVFVTNENRKDLETLAQMAAAGQLHPVIDRTYPLARAADALRYLEAGHARGKVVIAA